MEKSLIHQTHETCLLQAGGPTHQAHETYLSQAGGSFIYLKMEKSLMHQAHETCLSQAGGPHTPGTRDLPLTGR